MDIGLELMMPAPFSNVACCSGFIGRLSEGISGTGDFSEYGLFFGETDISLHAVHGVINVEDIINKL